MRERPRAPTAVSRVNKLIAGGFYPLAILAVNVLLVRKLFGVEYSAHLGSNEGTFIAIARHVAAYPWEWGWWPLWECGLPFQNTYLPLLPIATGWFSFWTGHSPALSFHQVGAALYCLGPVSLYAMAWGLTGRPGAGFLAALAYSVLSPCAWLVPLIRTDLGDVWNLRRLQTLAYYGEGPLTASMTVLPLAILGLYSASTRRKLWLWVAAGVAMAAAILCNAFGAVILGMVGLSLLGAAPAPRFWRLLGSLLAVSALTYAWISPLVPPSVLAAIRMNSPTVDGDYRFTARSLAGVTLLALGFAVVRWAIRKVPSGALRFFVLFTWLATGVVVLGATFKMYVVPQPHRYQLALDMGWCVLLVWGGAELFERAPRRLPLAAALTFLLLLFPLRHNVRYARGLIQAVDMTATSSYRVARWLDANMGGKRVMVAGSYSFQFNDFTDTPQILGGHDTMLPNLVMRIAGFVLYSGMNAGARDGEISVLWLQALGAHAVVVPGPQSSEVYKPFANPRKFEGLLPVLWREGDDTIYAVPARSSSLAHVLPAQAAVARTPIHGLDVAGIERYVQALNDPALPEATLLWRNPSAADISATMQPEQTVSVQVTYHPGWRATVNGGALPVQRDGLGLIHLEPRCNGRCDLTLMFDGGVEWQAARFASLLSAAMAILLLFRAWRRGRQ